MRIKNESKLAKQIFLALGFVGCVVTFLCMHFLNNEYDIFRRYGYAPIQYFFEDYFEAARWRFIFFIVDFIAQIQMWGCILTVLWVVYFAGSFLNFWLSQFLKT